MFSLTKPCTILQCRGTRFHTALPIPLGRELTNIPSDAPHTRIAAAERRADQSKDRCGAGKNMAGIFALSRCCQLLLIRRL